jgi:hypothetical protein
MENSISPQTDALLALLVQQVDANKVELIGYYQRALRETLFTNRAEVRPNILKDIAADEAGAFFNFLSQPEFSGVERGSQLYQIGLGLQAVLHLGHATRRFFLLNLECDQIAPMLETVHAYQNSLMQGFMQNLEKNHLIELEYIRNSPKRGSD